MMKMKISHQLIIFYEAEKKTQRTFCPVIASESAQIIIRINRFTDAHTHTQTKNSRTKRRKKENKKKGKLAKPWCDEYSLTFAISCNRLEQKLKSNQHSVENGFFLFRFKLLGVLFNTFTQIAYNQLANSIIQHWANCGGRGRWVSDDGNYNDDVVVIYVLICWNFAVAD